MSCPRKCPVCNSTSNTPIWHNMLAPISGIQLSNTITACDQCGFLFADGIPDEKTYAEYYTNLSKYDVVGVDVNPIDNLRVEAGAKLVNQFADKSAKVVDIGCGNSALLGNLKSQGYTKLIGIDPAKNCSERAKIYGIQDVYCGSIVDFDLGLVSDADVVLVMAVLEHLVTPKSSIDRLVNGMKVGARLIIEVPSLALFDGIKGEPLGELSIEHLQFFSLTSLTNLMVGLNLKLVGDYEMELPHALGALFAVFECTSDAATEFQDGSSDSVIMKKYVYDSNAKLARCFEQPIDKSIILYGAGAHSARLLPQLAERGIHVQAIVDGNPNYHGETLGEIEIQDPMVLADMPDTPILISSFRSEAAIKVFCTERFTNRLITFYGS
jgi:hypothetical protein